MEPAGIEPAYGEHATQGVRLTYVAVALVR